MKIIPLGHGFHTVVDDLDYPRIRSFHWHLGHGSTQIYAVAWIGGKKKRMHRHLLAPEKGLVVDHINRDSLDNRRCNLRAVTPLENVRNAKPLWRHNKHGTPNVYHQKQINRWYVQKRFKGVKYTFGCFKSKEEAVAQAIRLFGFENSRIRFCGAEENLALVLSKKTSLKRGAS